ncbi:hypothetical protein IC582_020629 [Cucumis melo]|uniref:Uncharacterized protein LOC103498564 isoform X1 n=1 Tax=Cucumis melo TaxID=3656 RepID=A0A1S3CAN3_CUCME|nr:uncharacterized protein LOC103498564 isoform X1 [Cucumis melo]
MGTEDFIALPASGDSGNETESNESLTFNETREAYSQSSVLKCKDDDASIEKAELVDDVQLEDMHCVPQSDLVDETQRSDSDMEIEDLNNLPDFSKTRSRSENSEILSKAEDLPVNSADGNILPSNEPLQQNELHTRYEDVCHVESQNFQKDLVDNSSFSKTGGQLTVMNGVSIDFNELNSGAPMENGSATSHHHGGPSKIQKSDGISGVKRPRMAMEAMDEQQPSVHIVYTSLTRDSKQKLDELLKQWSEWHAQQGSLSRDDKDTENLESGEETFFPALCVGTKKTSAVTFWMDNQKSEQQQTFVPIDDNSVPLYDRGFTLGLTSANDSSNVEGGQKIIDDASRCFNCGSYNHSLKDCRKPRDNAAVNNARNKYKKQHNSASRNSTRYYQNSRGGKYDDLRPGTLDAETRQLLGLKELDPPPWLNRMRELGYPPGYLDPEDEDQPSGITIYADEKTDEQEDGEITEAEYRKPQKKMSVEFPGINAPIPENADERLWAPEPSSSGLPRNRSNQRLNHYPEYDTRGNDHHQQRWSRDYRDDRPPGVDSIKSPPSFTPRYGGHDFSYDSQTPRGSFSTSRSPNLGRPHSDRGRRSPHRDDDYSRYSSSYSSSLFSPPRRR